MERYLNYNGYNFVDRFDTNSFLYLAKALDLYDVAWGYESLEEAFAQITAPLQFFAFSSDWLYPPAQTEEMVRATGESWQGGGLPPDHLRLRPRCLPP